MNVLSKITLPIIVCISLASCRQLQHTAPRVDVLPRLFNVQVPFKINARGILIPSYWGEDKKEHALYLDNHSPTWANNIIIEGNQSISKSKEFLYSTTTADGNIIEGDVYECANISIGNVNFKNVPFYNISNETNAGKPDGSIGENIMMEGIWKINFENHLIQFTSSIDSVKGLETAYKLPAVFTSNAIEIEVRFRNAEKKKFELDLGYNGWIIMPAAESKRLMAGNTKVYTDSMRFSTPGGVSVIQNTIATDSISIDGHYHNIFITSNDMIKERLIGWKFFSDFEFIVIDYLNKAVYVSKNKLRE